MKACFAFVALLLICALPLRSEPNLEVGLAQIRSGNVEGARAAMGRIADPAVADVLMWHLLRNRQGSFAEAKAFLARNPDWPGLPLLRARVEAGMPATTSPDRILAFFAETTPQTSRGTLLMATSLIAKGRRTEAEAKIIEFWLTRPMSASSHAGFVEVFGDAIGPYHPARLDALTWSGDINSAERVLPLMPAGPEAALARARIALRDGRPGVDALIEAVPEAWRDHQGLAYERFRWRLDRDRRDDALELLFAYDESADTLGNPVAWAGHRGRLARLLKQDGRAAEAYRVAARHHLEDGADDIASLEWLAGYIALRFLKAPEAAADHFRRFDRNVASPISKGRAGYWLGRALEAAGDTEGAQAAYRAGGKWQTSFYGQLAAERAGMDADPLLTGTEVFPPLSETGLARSTVLRAALALQGIGERSLAERFMAHMAETLPRDQIGTLIDVALDLDEPHIALLIAKRAAQSGHELHKGYFPVTELATLPTTVLPELSLAIARRESEFDPVVVSGAGARGLMQLMPGTAREMSDQLGIDYEQSRLTADPLYNALLGTTYLAELEAEFGQSTILVPAAYNAGPSRARRWSAQFGDPATTDRDLVDWIEDVPFSETRNYIMRVSESLLPYRARLSGKAGDVALSRWLREGYGGLRDGNGG
ncbi:lytic transglycosylase [Jannaschia pagri]|uniref:Lytic transglycosylase n=2 Tax=Jannaschia TaxID=188905 RepID=A0ABQ4NIP0_9RHOB|nr:lytic transglycosylase domain-containing protein [Jannaschia sp. AI_62]GIT89797.1 lytic transglycosylase [Jannaschia sp. AI_61]GIT94095.1 lytic transglycosylase [Jannaschia sp. AI_62]